jgi:glycosyltransferase involved in cell wall biosynthesis
MMDLEGGIRPALYLAHELTKKGCNVSVISPIMSQQIEQYLHSVGICPINLHISLFTKQLGLSLSWLELWAREAFFKLNSKSIDSPSQVTINFSHTLCFPSKFWYVQGPTAVGLKEGENELSIIQRWGYKTLTPLIDYADQKLIKDTAKQTIYIIANSKYCASLYQKNGIKIDEIIYPPVDCKVFSPQTSNPSADYVLTYFGKETKFSIIETVADLGIRIKAFGAKSPSIPKRMLKHPNIKFLGKIPIDELAKLYSNALFTLFPFTHEPFGYIPVESMACGTPTLTYNWQGPSESVVQGYNGWLVESDDKFVCEALRLWKQGYSNRIRANCAEQGKKFDKIFYMEKWLSKLEQ